MWTIQHSIWLGASGWVQIGGWIFAGVSLTFYGLHQLRNHANTPAPTLSDTPNNMRDYRRFRRIIVGLGALLMAPLILLLLLWGGSTPTTMFGIAVIGAPFGFVMVLWGIRELMSEPRNSAND
jgi:hypothetical protein